MAQEQGDEWLRRFHSRSHFRHDGDGYREKVGDIKAAEFHEVSRALLEKASYPLQGRRKNKFFDSRFLDENLTFD